MTVREKVTIGPGDVGTMPAAVLDEKVPLTTAITAVSGGELATNGIDEDFGEFEGAGFDKVDASHMAMPFLIVLQSGTPIVKRGPTHLDGAEEGMFYNQATSALYSGEEGVPFVPVDVDHKYVEFYPKEDDGSGGGFVGVRDPDDPLVLKLREEQGQFGRLRFEEGVDGEPTEIGETFSLIGWIVPGWDVGNASRVVVPFGSTKIQGYKRFISSMADLKYWSTKANRYVKPPMFAHRYVLKTEFRQKGAYSWYVISVRLDGRTKEEAFIPASSSLRRLGEELYRQYNSGKAKVAYERMEQENERPAAADDTPF